MKNRRIKAWHIVMVLFAAVLLILAVQYVPYWAFMHSNTLWTYCVDFDEYEDEFTLVKDYVMELYPDEEEKLLSISALGSEKAPRLYDVDTKTYLDCPSDITEALQIMLGHKQGLNIIRIFGNRVYFSMEMGYYSLVYSPDGKPTFVNGPNETCGCDVRRIGGGWYHVVLDNLRDLMGP